MFPMAVRVTALLILAACGTEAVAASEDHRPVDPARPRLDAFEIVAEQELARARLVLARDEDGNGVLFVQPPGGEAQAIPCDELPGAWGLWVDDVDGDGKAEAIVALRKSAKFDRNVANRLHVYGFEQGQCVPAWRGTRLAGRFEALTVERDRPGTLLVRERVGEERRRIARYRWNDFGYRLEDVLWEGSDAPPAALNDRLRGEQP
jgi:hypothetical protein